MLQTAVAKPWPIVVAIGTASAWGLFWMPLRAFRDMGLPAAWATLMQFAVPLAVLLPAALWRVVRGKPTGVGQFVTGLLLGGSFALYSDGLLLTQVARVLILFYVTPVWSTLLEITIMRRSLDRSRILALVFGFGGLVAILGGTTFIPMPHNLGDAMALAAGLFWAIGTMRVRKTEGNMAIFEHIFSFFLYGGIVALLVALLPIEQFGPMPSLAILSSVFPWLLLTALGFLIPVMTGLLWSSQKIDPGRLGIFLQMEVVVGITSAAALSNEPFGPSEIAGTILVLSAGFVDVVGGQRHSGDRLSAASGPSRSLENKG
jgi:drug/metabolite transporter (DMT)-like permease